MNERRALGRLRVALHLLAMALFAGTIVELLSVKHYDGTMQKVPFALCVLGLLTLVALWWRPGPGVILATRALMIVTALGSLLGIYEHVKGNYDFAREVQPKAGVWEVLQAAFHGRDPLLAPGTLALGAFLAIAVTYAIGALAATEPWSTLSRSGKRTMDWANWPQAR
jgi:hypothetical protein